MSLLLEALKKAERAKEEAQRRAGGEPDPAASSFDPEATVADPGKHVTTRDELPDIHAPLEILSEDLQSSRQKARPLELAIEEIATPAPPQPAPEPRPAAAPAQKREAARAGAQPQAQNTDRVAAQKVFEAKFKEPNPKLPFYITVGVLSVFAIGTAVYFWYQLRPPPPLVNANPPRPAGEQPPAVADAKPAAGVPAADSPPAAQAAIPGLPGAPAAAPAAAAPTPAPAPTPTPAPASSPSPAAPAPVASAPPKQGASPAAASPAAREPRAATPRAATPSTEERALTVNRAGAQVHPRVASGYAAYQAGDLMQARTDYEQALREDATNRDAALGLAAVEMRAQRYEQADAIYQRLLQANPRDPHAQAGMLALRGQALDPVQAESRVKSLLAADPEASVLHFTLGNQFAQQGRWAEAQQAYFKAYAGDPENPDYAFNLAVSLDQLRQPALALEYYRRALASAAKRSANFALDAARARVQQLSR